MPAGLRFLGTVKGKDCSTFKEWTGGIQITGFCAATKCDKIDSLLPMGAPQMGSSRY